MTETIALFGATGGTGKEFLPLALEAGYKVQAMLRNPAKLTLENENLTVIKGDFSDEDAISKTLKGATYIVSMAGGPMTGKSKDYPKDIMLNFVKTLLPLAKKEKSIKTLFFQAGAFSALPDGTLPFSLKVFRTVVGSWMMGLKPNFMDNEALIKYIDDEKASLPFAFIVSRPGGLKEGEGGQALKASDDPEIGFITFKDLAVFSLEAMKDESLHGTFPFVKMT